MIHKLYSEKIGYIEISDINNITANIEEFKYDYVNKLPIASKIILKDKDILMSKVRPYRNAITIFDDKYKYQVTASKNTFALYITNGFKIYIILLLI